MERIKPRMKYIFKLYAWVLTLEVNKILSNVNGKQAMTMELGKATYDSTYQLVL